MIVATKIIVENERNELLRLLTQAEQQREQLHKDNTEIQRSATQAFNAIDNRDE